MGSEYSMRAISYFLHFKMHERDADVQSARKESGLLEDRKLALFLLSFPVLFSCAPDRR